MSIEYKFRSEDSQSIRTSPVKTNSNYPVLKLFNNPENTANISADSGEYTRETAEPWVISI